MLYESNDDYEVEQYNAWQCDDCEEWTVVEQENSRLVGFNHPDFEHIYIFEGECDNCEDINYRFVPFSKLPHFEFMDWGEWHQIPEQSVIKMWNKVVQPDINKEVRKFAGQLACAEPEDFHGAA